MLLIGHMGIKNATANLYPSIISLQNVMPLQEMLIGLLDLICFRHEELYVVYDVALSTDSHFTVTIF